LIFFFEKYLTSRPKHILDNMSPTLSPAGEETKIFHLQNRIKF